MVALYSNLDRVTDSVRLDYESRAL
jgi:hypothetical protein